MTWYKPELAGIGPCARIRHTCIYIDALAIMVIYGGISDKSNFIQELSILRTDNMVWCNV